MGLNDYNSQYDGVPISEQVWVNEKYYPNPYRVEREIDRGNEFYGERPENKLAAQNIAKRRALKEARLIAEQGDESSDHS